jgi:hypothetical protein
LIDWAKSLDPDGKIARIIQILSQRNDILLDAPFMEGNLPTGHRTTILSGLPDVAWRFLNAGIQPSKSTKVQVDEACGMLEAYSKVDVDLAKLNGNEGAFRISEAKPFLEAMTQEAARVMMYGNQVAEPNKFMGLAPRYSSLSAGNAQNIIDGGGTTDLTSIWLIAWGEETVTGIFPRGSTVGLDHKDMGEQLDQAAAGVAGSLMRAFIDHWQWKLGLAVRDWRFAVRIANLSVPDMVAGNPQPDLIDLMEHAIELIPNELGNKRFYANRTSRRILRTQARRDVGAGGGLTFENFEGRRVMMFDEVPVRTVDQILNTETQVV